MCCEKENPKPNVQYRKYSAVHRIGTEAKLVIMQPKLGPATKICYYKKTQLRLNLLEVSFNYSWKMELYKTPNRIAFSSNIFNFIQYGKPVVHERNLWFLVRKILMKISYPK
jgi:hypothetical protein